jgi:hypothetical protein
MTSASLKIEADEQDNLATTIEIFQSASHSKQTSAYAFIQTVMGSEPAYWTLFYWRFVHVFG